MLEEKGAANLLVAAGKEYEFTPAPTDQVLAELEPLFNAWLQNLADFAPEIVSGNGDDAEDSIVRLARDWQSKVREHIVSQALILLRGAGPRAMVGKIVADSTGEGPKKVVSAGTYYQRLQWYLDRSGTHDGFASASLNAASCGSGRQNSHY